MYSVWVIHIPQMYGITVQLSAEDKVVSDYIDSVLYADCMLAQMVSLNCDTRQSMCGTFINAP